jgi:hypothetical protein
MYAERCKWSNGEKLDALSWTLEGKALDYRVILHIAVKCNRNLLYTIHLRVGLVTKSQQRQLKGNFHQAFHSSGESVDDFTDKLCALADKAFQGVFAQFITSHCISRFCHGLLDHQAGFYINMNDPSSVEQAKLVVRKYQQSHKAIFGRSKCSDRCDGKRIFSVSSDS